MWRRGSRRRAGIHHAGAAARSPPWGVAGGKRWSCAPCTATEVTALHSGPVSPPLKVVPSFACSVASLSRCPGHQLPGCHSLRRGILADYLLDRGGPSTCRAGHIVLQCTPSPNSRRDRRQRAPSEIVDVLAIICYKNYYASETKRILTRRTAANFAREQKEEADKNSTWQRRFSCHENLTMPSKCSNAQRLEF